MNILNYCVFSVILTISMLCGCASSKNFIRDSSAESSKNDLARIHIVRSTGIVASGVNFRVIDVNGGYGSIGRLASSAYASGNRYIIYYMSELSDKAVKSNTTQNQEALPSIVWSELGAFDDLCGDGVTLSFNRKENSIEDLKESYICPDESGIYIISGEHSAEPKQKSLYASSAPPVDLIMKGIIDMAIGSRTDAFFGYTYHHYTAVGEIANNDKITWLRPAGKLSLRFIGCIFTCNFVIPGVVGGLDYEVKAGKDYYIYFENGPFVISQTPRINASTKINIKQLFSNKTVDWEHHQKGYKATGYFSSDGTLNGVKNGYEVFNRRWSVDDSGDLCIHKSNGTSCRTIEKSGDVYKRIKIKSRGEYVHKSTYSNFVTGNPNNY